MKPAIRDSLALLFAGLSPLLMAYLAFIVFANDADRSHSLLKTLYSCGKFVQFIFPCIYVWIFYPDQLRTFSLAHRGVALGVAFGLLVDLAMAGIYLLLRDTELLAGSPAMIFGKLEEFGLATPGGFLLIALFVCLPHSLFEEYYWRWFVFGWLRRLIPTGWAMILASLGFMAHHVVILYVFFPGQFWTLAAPLSLCVAVGGAVWCWMYQRSGSLLGPWLCHVLIDAGIMLVGFDLVRGKFA